MKGTNEMTDEQKALRSSFVNEVMYEFGNDIFCVDPSMHRAVGVAVFNTIVERLFADGAMPDRDTMARAVLNATNEAAVAAADVKARLNGLALQWMENHK